MRNIILQGDVRERLRELPDESVHCVVTSPPYWGLRDYGTASWEGGESGCDHYQPTGAIHAPGSVKQASNSGTDLVQARSIKRAGLDAVGGVGTGTNPATLPPKNRTAGWAPTCTHEAPVVPCLVLDPGSGTTGLVAAKAGRDWLGIELSPEYVALAEKRLQYVKARLL